MIIKEYDSVFSGLQFLHIFYWFTYTRRYALTHGPKWMARRDSPMLWCVHGLFFAGTNVRKGGSPRSCIPFRSYVG